MTTTLRGTLQELSPAMIETLQASLLAEPVCNKGNRTDSQASSRLGGRTNEQIFSDTIYDLIRWWRSLWYIIDREPSPDEKDLQKLITIYLFSKKGDLSALQNKKDLDATQLLQRIQNHKDVHELCENQSQIGWMLKGKKNWACDGNQCLPH